MPAQLAEFALFLTGGRLTGVQNPHPAGASSSLVGETIRINLKLDPLPRRQRCELIARQGRTVKEDVAAARHGRDESTILVNHELFDGAERHRRRWINDLRSKDGQPGQERQLTGATSIVGPLYAFTLHCGDGVEGL